MSVSYFDTLIIGAGISGISAAHYLQTECPNKSFALLEGRKNIGGTWDLFRYPGIRSDSDMYTFGFAFRPWVAREAIAPRHMIMDYLNETVEEEDLRKHIKFEHRVSKASWSSETARWTLSVQLPDDEEPTTFSCSFLFLCTGYYNYEQGYSPNFEGSENFKGRIVHPQKWTEDIVYKNKKVVVIGSGATAVTLVPSLAEDAEHVTMLQRSPTYVVTQPAVDKVAERINKIFPKKLAFRINRYRKIKLHAFFYSFAKKHPKWARKLIFKGVQKELGRDYDAATHFNPSYNPWDQRLCLVPDSDLFKAIKSKQASVVTDHIVRFTEKGIELKSGAFLEADLIVTATGLNATAVSNFPLEVDGEVVDFSKKISYKGSMFSDVPNMALSFGYTNASWTLKCDLVSQYVCRLLNYMEENGHQVCCPKQNDPNLKLVPFLNFSPGYILRVVDKMPKLGAKHPWMIKEHYFYDKKMFTKETVADGILEFK